ncbi:hypothetical protein L198_01492 [Cryptococcus wingfieldii CBS 7118]|uniref:Uncharacterized protein n=1 Tax=Cryptococcus wingfieldii CBS 7118 TaxID=1295528 RepID=A0A1E3JZI1_9TREE|nr:hypothetical protein L198_01492 [Cryptococcus wingfieldii CBS 7118]ODO06260.1 hypothetical protein L198_01492 [Cryptococcus wingfieldii CBS 7118]
MFNHETDPVEATRPPPSPPNLAYLRSYSSPSHFNTSDFYTTQAPSYFDLDACHTTQPSILTRASSSEIYRHTPSPVTSPGSTTSSLSPTSTSGSSIYASSTQSLLISRNKRQDDAEANWDEVKDMIGEDEKRAPSNRKVDVWSPWVACAIQILLSIIMVVFYTFPPGTKIRMWLLFSNAVVSIIAMIFGLITLDLRRVWKSKKVGPLDAFLFFAVVCNALTLSFMLVGMFRGKVG